MENSNSSSKSHNVETVHFLGEWPHYGAQHWLVKFTAMSSNKVTSS